MNGCLKFRGCRAPVIFLIFFILPSVFAFRAVSASGKDDAWRSIQRGEEAVSSAFYAVLDAESAGGNVSGLVVRLNEAVNLLTKAEADGDVGSASRVVEVAAGVKDEALRLKASALSHRDFVFKVSLAGSIVGVPVFLLFMFFLWRWFREFYARRLLDLKPEVVSDVET